MRPKWSRSGKTSACGQEGAAGVYKMRAGSRFSSAMAWARKCLNRERIVRAALYGGIVRDDHHGRATDGPHARHEARRRCVAVILARQPLHKYPGTASPGHRVGRRARVLGVCRVHGGELRHRVHHPPGRRVAVRGAGAPAHDGARHSGERSRRSRLTGVQDGHGSVSVPVPNPAAGHRTCVPRMSDMMAIMRQFAEHSWR